MMREILSSTRKHFTGDLIFVLLLFGVTSLATGLISPILPLHLSSQGIETNLIGVFFSLGSFTLAVGGIIWGWAVDRIDRRVPLAIGTVGLGICIASFNLVNGVLGLSLLFLIYGLVRTPNYIISRWYMAVSMPSKTKALGMSFTIVVLAASQSISGFLSGLIADSWGFSANLSISSVLPIAIGLIALIVMQGDMGEGKTSPINEKEDNQSASLNNSLNERLHLFRLIPIAILLFACFGIILTFLPLLAVELHGMSTSQIGFLFGLYGLARLFAGIPLGTLADRMGKGLFILFSLILMAVGSLGFGMADGLLAMVVAVIPFSIAATIFDPSAASFLSDRVSAGNQGRMLGLFSFFEDIGLMLGPAAAGFLWQYAGPRSPFILGCALAGIGATYWFVLDMLKDRDLMKKVR